MIMKKHIIYIIIALFSTVFIACDDKKNDDSPLTGSWTYEEPHFQFEYAEDSIVFQIMQEPYKKKVEDLKTEFLAMATEKMGAYFKGVDFKNDGTLKINMSLQGGTTMAMGGTYKTDGKYVQINLDTEILQQIMGGNIPKFRRSALLIPYRTINYCFILIKFTLIHWFVPSWEMKNCVQKFFL